MSISVVVPSKDRAVWLARTVPIYLAQPEVTEVIVVIDGSVDDSVSVLEEISRGAEKDVHIVVNQHNRGTPYSKNRGISLAAGKYIFIGEDDVELVPGFFAKLTAHMEAGRYDVMCGRNIWRREDEDALTATARADALKPPYFDRKRLEIQTGFHTGSDRESILVAAPLLARREVFTKAKFDESYRVNFWREESDFQLSARRAGFKVGVCPHATCFNFVIQRDRSGSHHATGWRRWYWKVRNNWLFIHKHRDALRSDAGLKNPKLYLLVFAVRLIYAEVVRPFGLRTSEALPLVTNVYRHLRRLNEALRHNRQSGQI